MVAYLSYKIQRLEMAHLKKLGVGMGGVHHKSCKHLITNLQSTMKLICSTIKQLILAVKHSIIESTVWVFVVCV